MNALFRAAGLMLLLILVAGGVWSAEITEGQVIRVDRLVLTVKAVSGELLTFSPRFVSEHGHWVPARPARTIIPALESGEAVRIVWEIDTRENRRRIIDIDVTSPREGTSRGTVVQRNAWSLVIRVAEKPGTVTLNTKWVRVDGKWVPDSSISKAIQALKTGDRLTVRWAWDQEGRKRILSVANVEPATREPEHPQQ